MTQHNSFDPMGRESIQAIYKKQQKSPEDHWLQVKEPTEEAAYVSDFFKRNPITLLRKSHALL